MEYDFETEYFDIWTLGAEDAWNEVANISEGELYRKVSLLATLVEQNRF